MNTNYITLLQEIETLVNKGTKRRDILLSICKLLKNNVDHYDWVGFYILDAKESVLTLESYFGKATEHHTIAVGKGVCGQVAEHNKLKIVQDVSQESNYIACSIDVQSEIVVPILKDDKFVAEIDIDSHSPSPFTVDDENFLTSICQKLSILF
jgi:GAF domain-containing protein